MGSIHHHMVLKAIFADMLHQTLQIRNLGYRTVSESIQLIICQLTFTNVGFDDAFGIVGTDSPEGQGRSRRSTGKGSIGIFLAHGCS